MSESAFYQIPRIKLIPTRWVLYHERKGVYLGDGRWSALAPGEAASAPTYEGERDSVYSQVASVFTPKEVDRELKEDVAEGTIRPVEVLPDMGVRASAAACVASGLPGWTPGVGPLNPDLGAGG